MKKIDLKKHYVKEMPRDEGRDIDWSKAIVNPPMPKLKFSTESVTLRMPSSMVYDLKILANQRDIPYQSLMKVLLAQALEWEMKRRRLA